MAKGFLHLHITVVVLFMLFFGYKLFLLLSNKRESLTTFRQKTKIVDMVLGSLILVTGAYLLFVTKNTSPYIIGKLILTLAVIPLGIIGMKKENKILSTLVMIILIYNFGVAETKSLLFQKPKIRIEVSPTADSISSDAPVESNETGSIIDQNKETALANGKAIYTQVCTACHGVDGKLGVSDAKDLSLSTLQHDAVVSMITNGKGLMQSYKGLLSEQEIEAVASYVEGLRTK